MYYDDHRLRRTYYCNPKNLMSSIFGLVSEFESFRFFLTRIFECRGQFLLEILNVICLNEICNYTCDASKFRAI